MNISVASLFDVQTGQWKVQEITRLLGEQAVAQIINNVQKPDQGDGMADRLIWAETKSGRYSVKEGYRCLLNSTRQDSTHGSTVTWSHIWKWKNVIPKIKVFMWRLLTNALPLATNMSRRISAFSPMCQRCHQENEYATHCFFFCPGSRMVWFGGRLGLRTHDLPLDIVAAVQFITNGLNEDGIRIFCCTMWEIWKARNEAVIQHKKFEPQGVCQRVKACMGTRPQSVAQTEGGMQQRQFVPYEVYMGGWQVVIDASWDTGQRAGLAFLAYRDGRLHYMGLNHCTIEDPFHAEALALKQGITGFLGLEEVNTMDRVQFFSDCLSLVTAIADGDMENLPSWRAASTVEHLKTRMNQMGERASITHVYREAVQQAHDMANWARRTRRTYGGPPTTELMVSNSIDMLIDARFFQQVLEAPP